MFERWKKRRKLRKLARHIARELRDRFGTREHYTAQQVKTALEHHKQRKHHRGQKPGSDYTHYDHYAYGMFCTAEEFDQAKALDNAKCDYRELRTEICEHIFDGAADFSTSSLLHQLTVNQSLFSHNYHGVDSGSSDSGGGGGD